MFGELVDDAPCRLIVCPVFDAWDCAGAVEPLPAWNLFLFGRGSDVAPNGSTMRMSRLSLARQPRRPLPRAPQGIPRRGPMRLAC